MKYLIKNNYNYDTVAVITTVKKGFILSWCHTDDEDYDEEYKSLAEIKQQYFKEDPNFPLCSKDYILVKGLN